MTYDATMSMRQARDVYFAENGFGEDGGYNDPWVNFKIGPVPLPFPNTEGRLRAVRYHDLHHVLTGYHTDYLGELEIAAWELGAGCKDFYAAWHLNLGGAGSGALFIPRRTFRAFVRGRRSESLYGAPLEQLLDTTVGEARRRVETEESPADATDVALFAAVAVSGLILGTATLFVVLPLVPIGLGIAAIRRWTTRSETAKVTSSRPGASQA
ncbi:MAG: hypothetical protein ABIP89_13435 [Polyangiaceae bacterium]